MEPVLALMGHRDGRSLAEPCGLYRLAGAETPTRVTSASQRASEIDAPQMNVGEPCPSSNTGECTGA